MKKILLILVILVLASCTDQPKAITGNESRDTVLKKCIEKYISYYDSLNSNYSFKKVISIKQFSSGDTNKYRIFIHSFLGGVIYDSVYYCKYINDILYCADQKYPGFDDKAEFNEHMRKIFPKEFKYFVKYKKPPIPEFLIDAKLLYIEFFKDKFVSCHLKYL